MTGYYSDQSIKPLTATFERFPLGGTAHTVFLFNDDSIGSGNRVAFSWNGIDVHGVLHEKNFLSLDDINAGGIYLKYLSGAPSYRLIAASV